METNSVSVENFCCESGSVMTKAESQYDLHDQIKNINLKAYINVILQNPSVKI